MTSLLLGLGLVLLTAIVCGGCFRMIGQPPVVGEILGGILLGPSLLGALPGDPSRALFTPSTTAAIDIIGQLGVIVYLFGLGLQMDIASVRPRTRLLARVSTASMLVPFLVAAPLGIVLYADDGTAAGHGIGAVPFALFIGLAFSITAVPVLARIVADRKMTRMRLTQVVLASAIIQDFSVWVLLAGILALVHIDRSAGGFSGVLIGAVGLLLATAIASVLGARLRRRGRLNGEFKPGLRFLVATALLAAAGSSAAGLQPAPAAVLCGIACARALDRRSRQVTFGKLMPVIEGVLLPAYFLAPGLNVNLRAIGLTGALTVCWMVAVASLCKLGGTSLAARSCGLSWRQSATVGTLMNARGLVELIVLRIGYTAGLLSSRLFAELIVTAVITTLMTGPLLNLLMPDRRRAAGTVGGIAAELDLQAAQ